MPKQRDTATEPTLARNRAASHEYHLLALGGVLGYLLFTEGGRRARNSLREQLEGLVDDASRYSGSMEKMRSVASDGWRSVKDVFSALTADEVPYDEPDRGIRVS